MSSGYGKLLRLQSRDVVRHHFTSWEGMSGDLVERSFSEWYGGPRPSLVSLVLSEFATRGTSLLSWGELLSGELVVDELDFGVLYYVLVYVRGLDVVLTGWCMRESLRYEGGKWRRPAKYLRGMQVLREFLHV